MRLSDVLLVSSFLLCCTGAADGACRRFRVERGQVCALSLLLAALSRFSLPLGRGALYADCAFGLASLLLLLLSLLACAGGGGALLALFAAFFAGGMGSLAAALLPRAAEPGLLLGCIGALFAMLIPQSSRSAALTAVCAPLFTGLFQAAGELYYFSYPLFAFGTPVQLDAQIAGLFLLALLQRLPLRQGGLFKALRTGGGRLFSILQNRVKKCS